MDMPASPFAAESLSEATLHAVERAIGAFRRGELVVVETADGQVALARAAELLTNAALDRLQELAGTSPVVVLTGRRGAVLGLADGQASAVILRRAERFDAEIGRAHV